MTARYTIGIATYNNRAMLQRCMDAISASPEFCDCEVIIFNNGSESVGLWDGAQYDPRTSHFFNVIRSDGNIGVGAAYNKCFSLCRSPYFVTLNDDVIVKDPDWLGKMRAEFEADPQLVAVGVRTTQTSCEIDHDGLGCIGEELEYVEASCMMVRTSVIRQIPGGLFDPAYRFAYFEDSDLSLRLRKRGWKLALLPIEIEHPRASTTQRVMAEGVDVEGFHFHNQQVFKGRWREYLRKKDFTTRVAIRRTGAIGDVILTTPLLRAIRKQNAFAQISFYTDCPGVLQGNTNIASLIGASAWDRDWRSYDRAIDLDDAYESRPSSHIIEAYGEIAGIEITDWQTEIHFSKEDASWPAFVLPYCKGDYVVAHPHTGQKWLGRNPVLPFVQHVIDELRKQYKVVVIGVERSSPISADVDLRGKTTFLQAATVVSGASLFVGVDSALMHVAEAAQVPTVGIFGCMSPDKIMLPFPWCKAVTADRVEVGCLGCHRNYVHQPTGSPGRCMRKTDICMEKLSVERTMEAVEQVLKERAEATNEL